MPIETYEQALAFLQARVNYEQRGMPADIRELKLERMRLLLDYLGCPQDRLRIIHITGTKGKGSTAAMLDSVLRRAGYHIGLFTSPHLAHVEERIQIDGIPIAREDLTRHMRGVEQATHAVEARGEEPPTFFEVMTALGYSYFARRQVDLAVVEVGLGGRFDSTNVCTPLVSVITNVSYDHTEHLGPTLERIATEKAGIIKPGRPVVSGVTTPEARPVIEKTARERHATLLELGLDFTYESEPGDVDADRRQCVRLRRRGAPSPWYELNLWGDHQAANAALALRTLDILRHEGINVPDEAVVEGLRSVCWPARLEVVRRRPWVVLDCAHNVASIEALAEWLRSAIPTNDCALLLAVSRDKDLRGIVAPLARHFRSAVMTRYSGSARGAEPEDLAELWREQGGGEVGVDRDPRTAFERLSTGLRPDALLCVTGSVFLAGELRPTILADTASSRFSRMGHESCQAPFPSR